MAPMSAPRGTSLSPDSDYEYEYDLNDTETFYIDIDTSANYGFAEPSNKKRKLQHGPTRASRETSQSQTPVPSRVRGQERPTDSTRDSHEPDSPQPEGSPASTTQVQEDPQDAPGTEVQILGLDTLNPIISYRGQYFTCTWTDMIGTNLFISEPSDETPTSTTIPPLYTAPGFDLLAQSRIKLLARRAKLINRPGRKKRSHPAPTDEDVPFSPSSPEPDPSTSTLNGKSLGTLTSNNANVNREIKQQASFLERLMDIKRQKGETDNVRTVFNYSRNRDKDPSIKHATGSGGDKDTRKTKPPPKSREELTKEIEILNRKVVRGDRDALFRLEEIYELLEEEDQEDEDEDDGEQGQGQGQGSEEVSQQQQQQQQNINKQVDTGD
ncbi:hypothetical protein UCRPC4_g04252 [Phaeomoniella chlamydospora]|uniref:Transcription factor TFIIIC triple barrel domain-containing protein n=1 Tax=Phaeomoniella chlamydospora TaxID=158046 RepID=A0A0G2G8U6_PHACM|nr:hypothetical protein UCRPC4_g04252 [Phaeomoniella chlamydospora]